MDPQVRQFKDFLSLYNAITERCFNSCVDSLLTRKVEDNEVRYLDFCFELNFSVCLFRVLGHLCLILCRQICKCEPANDGHIC